MMRGFVGVIICCYIVVTKVFMKEDFEQDIINEFYRIEFLT